MHNREFKFGYQHFLLCQKSFLKVSSKWLLKNKSDNGKLLLGKTYSGERFRAILALLFKGSKYWLLGKILCSKLDLFGSKILMTKDDPLPQPIAARTQMLSLTMRNGIWLRIHQIILKNILCLFLQDLHTGM